MRKFARVGVAVIVYTSPILSARTQEQSVTTLQHVSTPVIAQISVTLHPLKRINRL
jgi:hypothetical protein